MESFAAITIYLFCITFCHSSTIPEISHDDSSNSSAAEVHSCDASSWLSNSSISVHVSKSIDGLWKKSFFTHNMLRNQSRSLNLNLKKKVIVCGGTNYLALSGYFNDANAEDISVVPDEKPLINVDVNKDGGTRRTEITAVDITLLNSVLQELRKSSDRMKSMEDVQARVESTIAKVEGHLTIVKQSMNTLENTMKTMNEKLNTLKEKQFGNEKNLNIIKDTFNNKLEVVEQSIEKLEATSYYGLTRQFDATVKGKNIVFSDDFRSATRVTRDDAYAGVVSNLPLKEDEVFQIRIEETLNKIQISGLVIGVINAKSDKIKESEVIFYRTTGTWSIFSGFDSPIGTSIAYKDNTTINLSYPLDTGYRKIKVGSVLGVSRRRNGHLHFYFDGVDCGPAFKDVPKDVYAFVDVVAYVTKISICN